MSTFAEFKKNLSELVHSRKLAFICVWVVAFTGFFWLLGKAKPSGFEDYMIFAIQLLGINGCYDLTKHFWRVPEASTFWSTGSWNLIFGAIAYLLTPIMLVLPFSNSIVGVLYAIFALIGMLFFMVAANNIERAYRIAAAKNHG